MAANFGFRSFAKLVPVVEGEQPEYWESVMLLPSPSSLANEEELEVGGERRSAWIKPADTQGSGFGGTGGRGPRLLEDG